MGRMRQPWYYERQAAEAQRRSDYFRNRTPPTEDSTINTRGAATDLCYRSLIQKEGTDHLIYSVSVPNTTLALVPATDVGLLTPAQIGSAVALRMRGSGVKPTKIHWYKGRATPIRRSTAWQTRVSIYHESGSHKSIPFSDASGEFTAKDLQNQFETLFGVGGSRRTLLGSANGQAYITWESTSVSAKT